MSGTAAGRQRSGRPRQSAGTGTNTARIRGHEDAVEVEAMDAARTPPAELQGAAPSAVSATTAAGA
nr:hypothetical protein [Streptomyces sp. TLI_235]